MNNKSYKKVQVEYIPNSPEDAINSLIHPIEEKKANAEVERSEIIYNPNTMLLQKAAGKKHSKGGTPVNLDEGSFIFSDFPKLGFKEKDIKQMEFKKGGSYKPKANTPAKVLEREVDLKHHNNMVNILQNEKKHDDITKKSAMLMLQKNMEKIGQVAFKQEQKKQFPTGQPEFAAGTAPVYSSDIDVDIDQSEQFKPIGYTPLKKWKSGGKFDLGGDLECPCGRDVNNNCIPCDKTNLPKALPFFDKAKKVVVAPNGYIPIATDTNGRQLYSSSKAFGINTNGPKASNADWRKIWANLSEERKNQIRLQAKGVNDQFVKTEPNYGMIGPPAPTEPITATPTGNTPATYNEQVRPTTYNVGLTPWQKINAAIPFVRAANVKTYYPIRQHQESVIPQLGNIDDQPYLNSINQSYFNASQQNRLQTNSASAIAGNEQLAGSRLDAENQAIGNVLNQNIQIQNQQKGLAANSLNRDASENRQFDNTYYNGVVTANQNRDDMRDYLNNQGLTNFNSAIEKNQEFNSVLNQQQQYKTDEVIGRSSDGSPIYRSRALYEPKANFFGYNTQYTPNLNINFKDLPGSADKNSTIDETITKLLSTGNYKDAAALMSSVAKYRYVPQGRK